MLNLFVC